MESELRYLDCEYRAISKKGCCLLGQKLMRTSNGHHLNKGYQWPRKETDALPRRFSIEGYGPYYMANFSPISRAEISARFLEQILVKSNWRLHEEGPSPGRNSDRAENPIPF